MPVVTYVIVIIAALFAIGSGVWVAAALVRAISGDRTAQTECRQPQSDTSGPD